MTRYVLAGCCLESDYPFASFSTFVSDIPCDLPCCTLKLRYAPPPDIPILFRIRHIDFDVCKVADGWLYLLSYVQDYALYTSEDYRQLTAYLPTLHSEPEKLLPLIRTALECIGIFAGVLSLHSSCVALNGRGICLTAPSGTGKSTRAASWQTGLGAQFFSGDRPSISVRTEGVMVSGAPWDGKEQLFINRSVQLGAICSIRRGSQTYLRKLSFTQAKEILCQQCFIPMWDTEAAVTALHLINRLCSLVPIYRVTCGPDETAAKQVRDILFDHPEKVKEAELEMKIKNGFVLRNISGEHIVMPTGKNISEFDGTIVLNDVAAFIWEKLCDGCSREELLQDILSEFDVDRLRAQTDLDALLEKLRQYQVIEEAV